MRTFSKGRKTPINDFDDLSYVKEATPYVRQSKEQILNAKSYHDLKDDLVRHKVGREVGFLLPLSTCATASDLFTFLSYEFIQDNLKKLSIIQRIKWHYDLEIKGFFRRLINDNDFGIDYFDILNHSFTNDKLAINKRHRIISDDYQEDDILSWTNEELMLQFDALRLAQYVLPDYLRPTCLSELTNYLVEKKFQQFWTHYEEQYNVMKDDYFLKDPFEFVYYSVSIRSKLKTDLKIDHGNILNKYSKLINKNFSTSEQEFHRCKAYLQMNERQRMIYNIKRIPARFMEIIE
jgi:hypothetical protein